MIEHRNGFECEDAEDRITQLESDIESLTDELEDTQAELDRIAALLGPHWDQHVLRTTDDEWGLQHAISCRPDLIGCPVNVAMQRYSSPPVSPGEWIVELGDDGALKFQAAT